MFNKNWMKLGAMLLGLLLIALAAQQAFAPYHQPYPPPKEKGPIEQLRKFLVLNEVLFRPASGEQLVEITNLGDTAVNMSGFQLVSSKGSSSYAFPKGTVLEAGSFLVIHIGVAGEDSRGELYAQDLTALGTEAGELALYRNDKLDDPISLVDYVQWGAAGGSLEELAVKARQWQQGEFVDTSKLEGGQSIAYDGKGDRASDWFVSTPTMGQRNR